MQEEFWSAEQLLNRIYQMDCLELLKKMPDETVSLILTDPPYGISYQNQYTCRKHRLLQGVKCYNKVVTGVANKI